MSIYLKIMTILQSKISSMFEDIYNNNTIETSKYKTDEDFVYLKTLFFENIKNQKTSNINSNNINDINNCNNSNIKNIKNKNCKNTIEKTYIKLFTFLENKFMSILEDVSLENDKLFNDKKVYKIDLYDSNLRVYFSIKIDLKTKMIFLENPKKQLSKFESSYSSDLSNSSNSSDSSEKVNVFKLKAQMNILQDKIPGKWINVEDNYSTSYTPDGVSITSSESQPIITKIEYLEPEIIKVIGSSFTSDMTVTIFCYGMKNELTFVNSMSCKLVTGNYNILNGTSATFSLEYQDTQNALIRCTHPDILKSGSIYFKNSEREERTEDQSQEYFSWVTDSKKVVYQSIISENKLPSINFVSYDEEKSYYLITVKGSNFNTSTIFEGVQYFNSEQKRFTCIYNPYFQYDSNINNTIPVSSVDSNSEHADYSVKILYLTSAIAYIQLIKKSDTSENETPISMSIKANNVGLTSNTYSHVF